MNLQTEVRLIENKIKKYLPDIIVSFDGNVYDISTDNTTLLIDIKDRSWELLSDNFIDYSECKDNLWSEKLKALPYIFISTANKQIISKRIKFKRKYFFQIKGSYYEVETLKPLK